MISDRRQDVEKQQPTTADHCDPPEHALPADPQPAPVQDGRQQRDNTAAAAAHHTTATAAATADS